MSLFHIKCFYYRSINSFDLSLLFIEYKHILANVSSAFLILLAFSSGVIFIFSTFAIRGTFFDTSFTSYHPTINHKTIGEESH